MGALSSMLLPAPQNYLQNLGVILQGCYNLNYITLYVTLSIVTQIKISRRLWPMKGFAQADRVEHKAKFQQEFMLCPEWAEAESEILIL